MMAMPSRCIRTRRRYMFLSPADFARTLENAAAHIERVSGRRPCAAFRPHAGWRSWPMYVGLKRIDHQLVGWGWMLWDWNWFRRRTADSVAERVSRRVHDGDIVVMHDGDESAPLADQRYAVEGCSQTDSRTQGERILVWNRL